MPNHRLNLAGMRAGKLVALYPHGVSKHGSVLWLCQCDCGVTKIVRASHFAHKTSCGCTYIPGNYTDLTGKQFGRLTVLGLQCRQGHSKWICQCSCGNTHVAMGSALTSGNTKSCGCGHIHVAPARRVWKNYGYQAQSRGLVFSLTLQQFTELISQPCFYCGKPPLQKGAFIHKPYRIYETFCYNGVDRMDNSKGYTVDNTALVVVYAIEIRAK